MQCLKLPYKELRSDAFRQAMHKLSTCGEFKDIKVTYNVMRMAKALEQVLSSSQKEWIALANKYVKKNDKGNYEVDDQGLVFLDGVDKDLAKKEIDQFLGKEAAIDRYKLNALDLIPAKITPAELAALEPILHLDESVTKLN